MCNMLKKRRKSSISSIRLRKEVKGGQIKRKKKYGVLRELRKRKLKKLRE